MKGWYPAVPNQAQGSLMNVVLQVGLGLWGFIRQRSLVKNCPEP